MKQLKSLHRLQRFSRPELLELIKDQLELLMNEHNWQAAQLILQPIHLVDIAEIIEHLSEREQAIIFRLLPKQDAIRVYEYFSPHLQAELLQEFKRPDVLEIINGMSADDRARFFEELPPEIVRELLFQLIPEEREATALILGYEANTAGRIMTPEYIALKETWTVEHSFEKIRQLEHKSETIYALYVTDSHHHIVGFLSLKELVIAQPNQTIGEIMSRHLITVDTDTDQKDVAKLLQRYDLISLPVVDRDHRIVGIITVDDVIDIIHEENTKHIHKLGGVQINDEPYFSGSIWKQSQQRAFWLITILSLNIILSFFMEKQEHILQKFIALVVFIPILSDVAGDIGCQSSTLIIRGLNTDEIRKKGSWWVIYRETIIGVLIGLGLGIAMMVWAYILQRDLMMAFVTGFSLFLVAILSTFSGTVLPFIASFFKVDPALISAPLISTLADLFTIIVYLYIARLMLFT